MLMLNNVKIGSKHFASHKSYRKGSDWISELDKCALSPLVINHVTGFSVLNRDSLPSDHAPITITMNLPNVDTNNLRTRAHHLGDHATLFNEVAQNKMVRRAINWIEAD